MTGDSLARAADELYAIPPAGFTAARNERARQAREAGDRELAAAIAGLRRPTASAWLVNLLSREAPDQVSRLLELGEELRAAQQALAGDRLRELSGRRRQLVAAVTEAAGRLAADAGQPASDQVQREVEATLDAALSDPGAATAVRSGRLARALSYAGLGGTDLTGAVAVPPGPAAPAGAGPARAGPAGAPRRPRDRAVTAPPPDTAARAAREAEAARHALREAEAAARDAQAAFETAEREADAAVTELRASRRRIEELSRELEQQQSAEPGLARAAREAARRRDRAQRSLAAAQRRLGSARDKRG